MTFPLFNGATWSWDGETTFDLTQLTPARLAHGLARVNRFCGATPRAYCPTPDMRVLTDDLRWVPAGDLKPGDGLVGFDEEPWEYGQAGQKRRRIRPAKVVAVFPVKRPIVRLIFSDESSVTASAEHPWLTSRKRSANTRWETQEEIARAVERGRKRCMRRYVKPWLHESTWDAGWLAGILDGEGHFSAKNRQGIVLGFSQNPGVVLAKALTLASDRCFRFRQSGQAKCQRVQLVGGLREAMRLLGVLRPARLLDTFKRHLQTGELGKQLDSDAAPLTVVRSERLPDAWVSGIETTTRTFICEGFGAHNSVAEHSVILARMTSGGVSGLAALLHDASEALGCADAHGKLKKMLCPKVRDFEAILCSAVWDRLVGPGNRPDWSSLKPWDQLLGDWEAHFFGFPNEWDRAGRMADPGCWDAGMAEHEWLYEWTRCGGKT